MDKKQLEEEIQNITRQLIEKYKPEKIILFGSAVRGEFGPDSDLDFLVIKKKVPFNGIERRWEIRRLVKKNLPADFLVYQPDELQACLKIGDPFIKTILEEGRILHG